MNLRSASQLRTGGPLNNEVEQGKFVMAMIIQEV